MSKAEGHCRPTPPASGVSVRIARCAADVIELAALRGHEPDLAEILRERGLAPPARGRCTTDDSILALSVRPQRLIILGEAAESGSTAMRWHGFCEGRAAVIDQSGGWCAWHLAGEGLAPCLARGCRLDPREYLAAGAASATLFAQVASMFAGLTTGMLLLAPISFARHVEEWFAHSGAAIGAAISLRQILLDEECT
ncbi:MAG: hypothetical protein U1F35_11280 [Steroidobacteraceae bacterium]